MSIKKKIYGIMQLMQQILHREVIGQVYFNKKSQMALTFDDGYGNVSQVLDKLKQYDVKATFFLVGEWMENNVEICKRMVEEGHEIGNHTYSHCKLKGLPIEEIKVEIGRTSEILTNITGGKNSLFRFPYRSLDKSLIRFIYSQGSKRLT